ncbi:MAG: hypothetical protein P9M11_02545 [Candidatus Tenebribacter burtonii]|nr:hypothetical protein [Candidatus Tenebribacter burtonii]
MLYLALYPLRELENTKSDACKHQQGGVDDRNYKEVQRIAE